MIDISLRIKSAVAQCLGVNISVEPAIFIEREELKALSKLGLNEAQLYTFIYQRIEEEEVRNGLLRLKTKNASFNLRLEEKEVGTGYERHLKLIKRVAMMDNQSASKADKADSFLQIRVKPTDKELWIETAETLGFKSLSSWVVDILNKESKNQSKKESA